MTPWKTHRLLYLKSSCRRLQMHRISLYLIVMILAAAVSADIPHIITYQGQLTDSNGAPLEGDFQITFTIYDMPENGTALWTSGPQTVPVGGGLFNYDLGSQIPIPDSVFMQHFERWLGIQVESEPEMLPRTTINSVAFAYRAQFADGAGMTEMAGEAEHAMFADTAMHAFSGGYAAETDHAIYADTALHAFSGDYAADADHAIYSDTADYAYAAPGGGFSLPYTGSVTVAGVAFHVDNEGTGSAIRGDSEGEDGIIGWSGASTKSGVYGYSVNGIGITGRSEGNNHGVFGATLTSDTAFAGVYGRGVNRGVIGEATGINGMGVYAKGGEAGFAGHFSGGQKGIKINLTPGDAKYYIGQFTTIDGESYSVDSSSYIGDVMRIYGDGNSVNTGYDAMVDGAMVNYGFYADVTNFTVVDPGYSYYGVSARAGGGNANYGVMTSANTGSSGLANDSLTCGLYSTGSNGKLNYGGLMYAIGIDTNYAIYTEAIAGARNYGIYAKAPTGASDWAGYFEGDVSVTGTFFGGTKYFKIDHPLDPANKYLIHSCVESSEQKNVYDGVALLDSDGGAIVELPEYFEALNRDFRYQLTAIGAPGPNLYIAEEVEDNSFTIAGGTPGSKVSWMITGIRNDAAAQSRPMQTEVDKPVSEQGTYLDPMAYGLGEEYGIHYKQHQGRQKERERVLQEQQAYQSNMRRDLDK
jgi:hypothetical protein